MKLTNEKVYRCDFCNKAIISKGSMTLHERMCKKNPKNQHQCFKWCKHLQKEYIAESGEASFTCHNLPGDLYSYKLERFKSKAKRCEGMIRMPLKCDFYQISPKHDGYGESGLELLTETGWNILTQ